MTRDLTNIRDLIARLSDLGIVAVCVGGAARDTFIGQVPKDYDLAILDYPEDETAETLQAAFQDATGASVVYDLREQGNGSEGTSDSHGDGEARGLHGVYEVRECGGELLQVQFLVYTRDKMDGFDENPLLVVQQHDCTLNQAWFEEVGGRLMPCVSEAFPTNGNGLPNVFRDVHVNPERKAYIRQKFPLYTHI